jgi:hypothetical protein
MPRQEWGGIEPMGELFLLTFLFIGLCRPRVSTERPRDGLSRDCPANRNENPNYISHTHFPRVRKLIPRQSLDRR